MASRTCLEVGLTILLAASPVSARAAEEGKETVPPTISQGEGAELAEQVASARRVLAVMRVSDIWLMPEDVWRVKQITVAGQMKISPEALRQALLNGFEQMKALAAQDEALAWERWGEAGDLAFAAFHLPEAEQAYTEASARAARAGDVATVLRMKEKIADVLAAARRDEDEHRLRQEIETQRRDVGLADPMPMATAVRIALNELSRRRGAEALSELNAAIQTQPEHLDPVREDLLEAWVMRFCIMRESRQPVSVCEAEARRILAECEKTFGKSDRHTAMAEARLALMFAQTERRPQAEEPITHSIAIFKQEYGPDHPLTLWAERILSVVYCAAGKFGEARTLTEHTLESCERYLPPVHYEIAQDMMMLADIAFRTGRLTESQRFLRGAADMFEKTIGRDAAQTKGARAALVSVNERILGGKGTEASLQKALSADALRQMTYSVENVSQLYTVWQALFDAQRFAEAEQHWSRAVELMENAGETEILLFSHCLQGLARCSSRKSDYLEAEALLRRALAIREKKEGAENPDLVSLVDDLAEVLFSQGRPTEGNALLQRAAHLCTISETGAVPDDMRNTLIVLLNRYGQYERALVLEQKMLESVEFKLGKKHPNYCRALNNLARTLIKLGRFDEAGQALQQVIVLGEALPAENLELPNGLCSLAVLHQERHETSPADVAFRRAITLLRLQESRRGVELSDLKSAFKLYALFLQTTTLTKGEVDERIEHLRRGEKVLPL